MTPEQVDNELKRLTRDGLSRLRDVVLDVQKQLDFLQDDVIEIPMWPPSSWDEQREKKQTIIHDEYEKGRMAVLRRLKDWGVIGVFQLGGNRFRNYVTTKLDRAKFAELTQAVEKRWDLVNSTWKVKSIPSIIRPRFDEANSVIMLGQKRIPIQRGSVQYHICQSIFEHPGEWVTVTKILSSYDGESHSDRKVYYGVRAVNKKSKETLGIPVLIEYKASRLRLSIGT